MLFATGVSSVHCRNRRPFHAVVYPDQFALERGSGWETLEEQLEEAIDLLPVDEKPLAEFLIELLS